MLRDYQTAIISQVRAHMVAGQKSIIVVAPTGSGKTLLTASMLGTAASKGMPSWFTVHRRELIKQSTRTFSKVGVTHGIIAAGFVEDPRPLIKIGSVNTLARRFKKLAAPRLIIWDECHHIAAAGWAAIHEAFPDAFHVGLTATPERLDGKGLGKYFKVMVNGPSVAWLIENNYLSPYKIFVPPGLSVAGMHTRMGDFVKSELSEAADKPTITGDAIKHYQAHASGKRAVVFCVTIEHSKHVVEQFNAAGIRAEHVDGETDQEIRDAAIKRFESGETLVLSNVDLFGEGFDLPAIEAVILLRPTQSLGLYLQQVGRGLRVSPGKTHAVILDHAGNCERHGLPDDERTWSLAGRQGQGRAGSSALSVKVCPKCFAAQKVGESRCGYCGFEFVVEAREIEQAEGDLVEINAEELRKRRQELTKADGEEDLIAIAKKRGYRRPELWARHVLMQRRARFITEIE